jgi:Mg/Co/Ni transporter MgtE
MASDDAADLLLEIKQERRRPVLDLLPYAKQRKIKGLLGYNPSTAGGVMSPDFVAVPREATVGQAIAAARAHDIAPESLYVILLTDPDGQLSGVVTAGQLIRAAAEQTLDSLADSGAPSVGAEAEIPEVARLMTDYNLVSLPVLDADGRPIGIVSVDDILELTLPEQWRRRYGLARE